MPMYIVLSLHIVANSKKNEILGIVENRLKIKIKAPAIEGKANKELIKFLSQEFAVPKSEITIIRGEHSKFKQVKILSSEKLEAYF